MASLPLAATAVIGEQILNHLAIASDGEVLVVFPRGTPYVKIKRLADRLPNSEIRVQKVRVTYEVLEENEVYDTSPKVKY